MCGDQIRSDAVVVNTGSSSGEKGMLDRYFSWGTD